MCPIVIFVVERRWGLINKVLKKQYKHTKHIQKIIYFFAVVYDKRNYQVKGKGVGHRHLNRTQKGRERITKRCIYTHRCILRKRQQVLNVYVIV